MFAPERARAPLKNLSGGERNRLLLARLFLRPANVLVLDEPTNDLDVETLELLESLLMEYQGTLIVVSHDRAFLDNVVTSLLIFRGKGDIEEHIGGYSDWLHTHGARRDKGSGPAAKENPVKAGKKKQKLSYREQRELESLPLEIEKLELEQQQLTEQMAAADFYQQDKEVIAGSTQRLKDIEQSLSAAYARWEKLESFSG